MRKRAVFLVLLLLAVAALTPALWYSRSSQAQARRTIYWGNSGDDVRAVQQTLKNWGYYDGPVDGWYGPATFDAVRFFQWKNWLPVTGNVDDATWAGLGYPPVAPAPAGATGGAAAGPAPRGVSRDDDVYLLAQAVHAEANGEPYEGQVGVGAVILNRTQAPGFPKTLAGVIFEPSAFESVSNGTFFSPPESTNINAARDAMNGWDPTGGAIFFWNPSKPVSGWIWSRPIITQIGAHVFAR